MTAPLLTYGTRSPKGDDILRVNLDTMYETRLLIQGSSGAGKTQACFHLLEETHGRVQQIVVDKEGEFEKLREQFDYLLIGGDGEQRIHLRKGALELQLHRVLELEISAIYDLSDLVPEQQQHVVARLARAMAHLPRSSGLWERMRIALFDELQWFAPQNGKAESSEPLIELASTGRKRGFCFIGAGTRVSMMSKSVTELLENKLIGRSGMNDSERAAKELEFDKHGRKELRTLPNGHFFAYGPAFALDPVLVRTPAELPVLPRRRGEHRAPTPATSAKVKRALAKFEGIEQEAEQKERTLDEATAALAAANARIRALEKGTAVRTVEKPVADPRAIERAVKEAARASNAKLTNLRKALESAMKFIVNISTANFDVAGVNKEELERAITAAVGKATQIIDQRLTARSATVEKVRDEAKRLLATLKALADEQEITVSVDVAKNEPFSVSATQGGVLVRRPVAPARVVPVDGVTGVEQKILNTLAGMESLGVMQPDRVTVAALCDYSNMRSKSFMNALGSLRTAGRVQYPSDGRLGLTDEGRAIATNSLPVSSIEELHQHWFGLLGGVSERILRPLLADGHPVALPVAEVAASAGYENQRSKSFMNAKGRLRTLGLVSYPGDGMIMATDLLFPEGLR